MQIRQAYVLADVPEEVGGLLPGFEELGLQICERDETDILKEIASDGRGFWSESLLICGSGHSESPSGTAMIREAVDAGCPVLMGPETVGRVLDEIRADGEISEETGREMAAQALYSCIGADARRLAAIQGDGIGSRYKVDVYEKVQDLRYGENWHQKAALYRKPGAMGLHMAKKLSGRELSYNNVVDAESVLEMLIDLNQYDGVSVNRPLAVIVKHTNPCGIAYGGDLPAAYRSAFSTDPKSAFGGVIGFTRPVDVKTAKAIGESFVEVLLAPGYDPEALEILMTKPNRRILDLGDLLTRKDDLYKGFTSKSIFGGLLAQDHDTGDIKEWNVVTKRNPTDEENRALRFAWKVTKYVKSNALVYATADMTVGIGSGQVSRVDAARFGAEKAEEHGLSTVGTVAATDSFFPFRDGLDQAYEAGATAVVHPGGSIRDSEVIAAADEHEMAMAFTGMRHFRH